MNHYLYSFLALSLANDRAAEADAYRRMSMARADQEASPSLVRRSLARGLAAVSRGSASVVRRLDGCIADDLGRSLAPTE
ncbi:MAG: hypothetical protein HY262_09605 [Chloroflexi bacterium]|nr:hypothetical protein [Chloroflexota bacterium]